MPTSSVYRF
uniref:Uncharacterized protein n=1 Tax=Anguilla anguilla TaxID=7936 RepID=A0A0E9RBH2_ANGAN